MILDLIFSTFLIILTIGVISTSNLPTVKVVSHCTETDQGKVIVEVFVDASQYRSYAVCAGDRRVDLKTLRASQFVEVYFPQSARHSDACVFNKRAHSRTYTMDIQVGLGDVGIEFFQHKYRVTCLYDPYESSVSDVSKYVDVLSPGADLYYTAGGYSHSAISLDVVDITGNPLPLTIPIGKPVRLRAVLRLSLSGEISFQVIGCRAFGVYGSFPILEAGCGDGQVIPKNKGFVTRHKEALSYQFESFRLRGSHVINYRCRFIICLSPCDGLSCQTRNKRNANVESPWRLDPFYNVDQLTNYGNGISTKTRTPTHAETSQLSALTKGPTDYHKTGELHSVTTDLASTLSGSGAISQRVMMTENVTRTDITMTRETKNWTLRKGNKMRILNETDDIAITETVLPSDREKDKGTTTKPRYDIRSYVTKTAHATKSQMWNNTNDVFFNNTEIPAMQTHNMSVIVDEKEKEIDPLKRWNMTRTKINITTKMQHPFLNATEKGGENLPIHLTDQQTSPNVSSDHAKHTVNLVTIGTDTPQNGKLEPGFTMPPYLTVMIIVCICLAVIAFIVTISRYHRISQRRYLAVY